MGLLDDAIREHLDLKRRRGADPAEVERAEREALGPVRRNRDPAGATATEDAALAAEAPARAPAESAWDDPDEGLATDLVEEDPAGPPTAEETYVDTAEAAPDASEDWTYDDARTRIVEAGEGIVSAAGQETTEFSLEDALAAEESAAEGESDEDVLEETPEFLQDTPDHDRLWFEQRPPRDFDFDG